MATELTDEMRIAIADYFEHRSRYPVTGDIFDPEQRLAILSASCDLRRGVTDIERLRSLFGRQYEQLRFMIDDVRTGEIQESEAWRVEARETTLPLIRRFLEDIGLDPEEQEQAYLRFKKRLEEKYRKPERR